MQYAIISLPWRKNQKPILNHCSESGAIDEAEHFKSGHE